MNTEKIYMRNDHISLYRDVDLIKSLQIVSNEIKFSKKLIFHGIFQDKLIKFPCRLCKFPQN